MLLRRLHPLKKNGLIHSSQGILLLNLKIHRKVRKDQSVQKVACCNFCQKSIIYQGEPLTYRDPEDQERTQHPRKTKSVEKIKDQPTQLDEDEGEKPKEFENKFIFAPKNSVDFQLEADILSLENKAPFNYMDLVITLKISRLKCVNY